jgi:endonuclease YncB( thermonuclease family)
MAIVKRKVQKVIDGDTFKVHKNVGGSQYVRIAGVNAPERGQRGYDSAKRRLSRMTGKTISIKPVGRSYGRTVAHVPYAKRLMKRR